MGFKLTTLEVMKLIAYSYKSNYHMIRTMMAPDIKRRNIVKDILNVVVKILNITGQVTGLSPKIIIIILFT